MKATKTSSFAFDPSKLNKTELAQVCRLINPEAHRGLPREVLELIAAGEEVELPQRVVNKTRLRIMRYINDNWRGVEYQVSCPAKSRDPHACFQCSDTQVAECTLSNTKMKFND